MNTTRERGKYVQQYCQSMDGSNIAYRCYFVFLCLYVFCLRLCEKLQNYWNRQRLPLFPECQRTRLLVQNVLMY